MSKQMYVGINKIKYVEYIQSSGTQYIDTGFKPNGNTRVVIDFQLNEAAGSSAKAIFGQRSGISQNTYLLIAYTNGFRSDYNATIGNVIATDIQTSRVTVDKNKGSTTIGSYSSTIADGAFTGQYNLLLFATNNTGTVSWHSSMKLYSCKIYDNGTLVRDFLPCINASGDVGLYDKKNGVFYGNSGSGKFVAGAETNSTISVAHRTTKFYLGVGGIARSAKYGYVGANGIARKFYESIKVDPGHYWVIDTAGMKEYDKDGNLLKSTSGTITTWDCPMDGTYSIELHALGGHGGKGKGEYYLSGSDRSAAAAGGGGGGGSGAKANITLNSGTYNVSMSGSITEIYGNGIERNYYYVKSGNNGGDGTAQAGNGYASATAGYGGSRGSTSSNMTNIASSGWNGTVKKNTISSYASATGGSGGTGGATIGLYGYGGDGGDANQDSYESGDVGTSGAIIIRKL